MLVEKEQTRQAGNLGRQLTELQEARMGVHQQQIEIAGQVAEVKRVLGAVRMLEGRAGLREGVVTRHDAENVPAPPERVSLKAVEALEAAVDRASRNLQVRASERAKGAGEGRGRASEASATGSFILAQRRAHQPTRATDARATSFACARPN